MDDGATKTPMQLAEEALAAAEAKLKDALERMVQAGAARDQVGARAAMKLAQEAERAFDEALAAILAAEGK